MSQHTFHKKARQVLCLGLCLFGLSNLTACDIVDGLSDIDLGNILFENSCGTYTFHNKTGNERCGTNWDSFGFLYQEDQIAQVFFSHDSDAALDYIPNYQIWFDSRYLKPGETIGPGQALAQCSRLKPEDPLSGSSYFTVGTRDFSLKVVKDLGVKEDDILDDQSRWVLAWEINCPDLQMSAKGQDEIDLDMNPIPARWERVGDAKPPVYQAGSDSTSEN